MNSRALLALVCCLAAVHSAGAMGATAGDAASAALPTSMPLTRETLLGCLSRDLTAHFNLEGTLDLELIRAWTPPARVARDWNIAITEYPTLAGSAMMIHCRIQADGETVGDTTFFVRASLWRDAWATRAPLTINATFDPSLLEARRVDLFRERDALPAAVGDRSYIFARGVPPGRLLTWRDIARRPLVRRGEVVEVSAVSGALIVTMKGVAMENGAQGDTVTVRNPDSRKDFAATVVDENHVQVRL